jgi:hypothetical protein
MRGTALTGGPVECAAIAGLSGMNIRKVGLDHE